MFQRFNPGRGLTLAILISTAVMGLGGIAVSRAGGSHPGSPALRVCSDPNNLPFSNLRGQGFENALARMVARDLGRTVEYTWWAQRRGFIRNTLDAGACDVVMGVPAAFDRALTSLPYYRSTYVWVSRADRKLRFRSLDDPRLRRLTIGLHLIGDDGASVPPAQALARRGIAKNLRGYSIYGDYSTPNPPSALIAAVARGDIDVAVAWGPLAGYFARQQPVRLEITPIAPGSDGPALPFVYDIAMGVRRKDTALRAQLNEVIRRRQRDITSLLREYGVPLVGDGIGVPRARPAELAVAARQRTRRGSR